MLAATDRVADGRSLMHGELTNISWRESFLETARRPAIGIDSTDGALIGHGHATSSKEALNERALARECRVAVTATLGVAWTSPSRGVMRVGIGG